MPAVLSTVLSTVALAKVEALAEVEALAKVGGLGLEDLVGFLCNLLSSWPSPTIPPPVVI